MPCRSTSAGLAGLVIEDGGLKVLFLLGLMTMVFAGSAAAQGIVVGRDGRPVMLHLRNHRVEADVQERLAVVTVEHV